MFISGAVAQTGVKTTVQHLDFERPEAWALKYFTSSTLLAGLPLTPGEERRAGSVTVSLELGWIPNLNPDRARVGFTGRKVEDLNKAPILARPVVRVGLPWKFTVMAAVPPPFEVFGVTPRLAAFGLERPIVERRRWSFGWRGYGQFGSVKGAFSCPPGAAGQPAGSPGNPNGCVGESRDVASLSYEGMELSFAHRIPGFPRLTPHVAVAGNYMDAKYQVDAPLATVHDRTRLWTRGKTFSTTAGVSYQLSKHAEFAVDAFYTPLWVRRVDTQPAAIDGLFNVRALVSYSFR
jgi:hypothetical protein